MTFRIEGFCEEIYIYTLDRAFLFYKMEDDYKLQSEDHVRFLVKSGDFIHRIANENLRNWSAQFRGREYKVFEYDIDDPDKVELLESCDESHYEYQEFKYLPDGILGNFIMYDGQLVEGRDLSEQPDDESDEDDEKEVYEVKLISPGKLKSRVAVAVKGRLKISLSEAKDLIDSAPCVLAKNVDYEFAADIKNWLEDLGAQAEVRQMKKRSVEPSSQKKGKISQAADGLNRKQSAKPSGQGINKPSDRPGFNSTVYAKDAVKMDAQGKAEPSDETREKLSNIEAVSAKLTEISQRIVKAEREWKDKAKGLFKKACIANVHIEIFPDGKSISPAENRDGNRAGVYFNFVQQVRQSRMPELPADVRKDLNDRAVEVQRLWGEISRYNESFWSLFDSLNVPGTQTQHYKYCDEALGALAKYKDEMGKKAKLEAKELAFNRMIDADPVLAGFAKGSSTVYDASWMKRVQEAASKRKTLEYLPLNSWDSNNSFLHKWSGSESPYNLIIDSEHLETEQERKDMLDNFVATMLLAFPIKKVHFTVIEHHQVNPFVASLPEKVCTVFDIRDNADEIRRFVRQLKDMNRAGKARNAEKYSPQEIVILAGYDKKDREFEQLIESLTDVIKEGYNAGIYFALLLTDDYTEYETSSEAEIPLGKYFQRYSTICSNVDGNWIPDYKMLEQDAMWIDNEDCEQVGTLGDMISYYVQKQSSTTPNKVYEGIAGGNLYRDKPITDLGNQNRIDANNIVVPVAETEDGNRIDLRLNATDFISYFILGRSGMGKSFTLHTILTNLMLKYDPSVVDIILMDFKPGGVEMNYYKDVPHVSKLLVNGADKQVAQEILQSIMKEMDRRGELFQDADVSSIDRYNDYARRNGLEQMKHIVMLVDECQDLFKVQNPNSDVNIVTDIARKGRSYGIHMILATQTLQGADIPGDALAQFSDFLFMGCKEDDVVKCEINDREVQRSVNTLTKGEVIYCHRAAEPVHGYVYNFAGKDGVYRDKTHDSLLSDRFTPAAEKQFYFNASQIYRLDSNELKALADKADSGMRPVPMALLGKNMTVTAEAMPMRMRRGEGGNLLVLGANDLLQSERVLWNAVTSLYYVNKKIDNRSQYFILPNFPEDMAPEARDESEARNKIVRSISRLDGIQLVDEYDRASIIERVAAAVRQRMAIADNDHRAIDRLDSIYLIIPNQQLYYTRMSKAPRGLESIDTGASVAFRNNSFFSEPARSQMAGASAQPSQSKNDIDIKEAKMMLYEKVKEYRPKARELALSGRPDVWKNLEDDYYGIVRAAKHGAMRLSDLDFEFKSDITKETFGLATGASEHSPSTDSLGFESLSAPSSQVDSLGFESLTDPTPSNAPVFADIDMNFCMSAPAPTPVSTARPGRDLNEELKTILANGSMVKVHVLMHSTTPEKIFSDDMLRQAEMQLFFNDIVFLKMLQADRMSLPVDSRDIEKLSSQPKSLRAIAYNGERGQRTIVPFDFPSEELVDNIK